MCEFFKFKPSDLIILNALTAVAMINVLILSHHVNPKITKLKSISEMAPQTHKALVNWTKMKKN